MPRSSYHEDLTDRTAAAQSQCIETNGHYLYSLTAVGKSKSGSPTCTVTLKGTNRLQTGSSKTGETLITLTVNDDADFNGAITTKPYRFVFVDIGTPTTITVDSWHLFMTGKDGTA